MISIYFIFPAFPLFLSFLGGVSMLIHVIYPIFMSSYRHTVFGDLKLANRSGRSPFSVQDTPWGETKQPFLFPATWRLKKTCGKIEWTLPQPCLQTYSKYIISIYIYIYCQSPSQLIPKSLQIIQCQTSGSNWSTFASWLGESAPRGGSLLLEHPDEWGRKNHQEKSWDSEIPKWFFMIFASFRMISKTILRLPGSDVFADFQQLNKSTTQ